MAKLTAQILFDNKEIELLKKCIEEHNKSLLGTIYKIEEITDRNDLNDYQNVVISCLDKDKIYISKNKASDFYYLGLQMQREITDNLNSPRRKTLSSKPQVIAKDKLKPPFYIDGKTSFSLQNISGVYMIYEDGKLVYIGYSKKDVYKALYRHFYPYREKPKQERKYWKDTKNIKVRVIYTNTPGRAENLEIALIQKYKPKLNTVQYKAWLPNQKEKSILEIYENSNDIVINTDEDLPF